MARLYADENFPGPSVEALAERGHDVLTSHAAGKAGMAVPDEEVLAFASAEQRILLTMNRRHFIRLHQEGQAHAGIIVCTFDPDFAALAGRIDALLAEHADWAGRIERVNRPADGAPEAPELT